MTEKKSTKKPSYMTNVALVDFVIILVGGFLFLGWFFGSGATFGTSQGRSIDNMLGSILALGMFMGLAISYLVMKKTTARPESARISPPLSIGLGLVLIVVSLSFFTFTSAGSCCGEDEYYIVLPIKAYSIMVSTIGCIFIGGSIPFLDKL